jgi:hypothetical protein
MHYENQLYFVIYVISIDVSISITSYISSFIGTFKVSFRSIIEIGPTTENIIKIKYGFILIEAAIGNA